MFLIKTADIMEVIYSFGRKLGDDGIERIACQSVKGIERHGCLKKALCTSHENCINEDKIVALLPFLDSIPIPSRVYLVRREIYDLVAKRHIDECDIFYGWGGTYLYSLRKAKKFGAKIFGSGSSSHILYQRKLMIEEYSKFNVNINLNRFPINLETRKFLKEVEELDYITAASKFVKESYMAHGMDESQIFIVPYGVDVEEFKPQEKKDGTFRVLFVGHASIRKGIPYLLKAWKELDLKNAELVLVGIIRKDVRNIIEQYRQIIDFKTIGVTDPLMYYNDASVFVLPSIEEGSALVTYEAMACGLPVIVTENTRSVARDGKDGFVIPIRNVEALKEKIQYFYDNESERERMGRSARKHIENYTWEKYGDNLVGAYEKVV